MKLLLDIYIYLYIYIHYGDSRIIISRHARYLVDSNVALLKSQCVHTVPSVRPFPSSYRSQVVPAGTGRANMKD